MRQAHSKGYVFGFKNDLLMNQTKLRDTSMPAISSESSYQIEAYEVPQSVNSDLTERIKAAETGGMEEIKQEMT